MMKHKSNPAKYPLPIPTTVFEVAYLKILSEEAARESQEKMAEVTRKFQEANILSKEKMAEMIWKAAEYNRIYSVWVAGIWVISASILGLSIVNTGAGGARAIEMISKTLESFLRSFNDFLTIIRSFSFRSFIIGGGTKKKQ